MPEEILDTLSPLADVVTRLEAQAILCVGHNKLYALLRRGELVAVKDGAKTLITIESLRRYQANRPKATFMPPVEPISGFHTIKPRPTRRRSKRA